MQDKSRRDLCRGSLEVMLLSVLADGRSYGYAIREKLQNAGGQPVQFGTLYPLLHRLEAEGHIKATWDRSTKRERKWYELTPTGKRELRRSAADWQAYLARLQSLVLPAVRNVAGKSGQSFG